MNNYIILNGVNSNTITGLIISSLPPITKPLMRTNIETIDGKDGDIITKLGYSAYDKEITIGLSYNYNVDDVIKYFNSEGTVIFSNEPTKYYKYTILDQIDFEKLIRFKTATVRMHVQPFKYSSIEENIEENATETDNEGTNFTLENTENGAGFIDLKLKGDTYQETTTGKNVFNKDNKYNTMTTVNNGDATTTITADKITITTGSSNNSGFYIVGSNFSTYIDNLDTTKDYYISMDVKANRNINIQMGVVRRPVHAITTTLTRITTTTNINGTAGFVVWSNSNTANDTIEVSNIMISTSNQNTYEPYTNGPSPNPNYPQDIDVVTGDNTVNLYGKNLFDISSFTTSTSFYISKTYKLNGTYTLSTNINYALTYPSSSEVFLVKDGETPSTSGNGILSQNKRTYICDGEYKVYVRNITITPIDNLINGDYFIQLEKGTTATNFEPYQSQSYTLSLGDVELCKIGDYQDYIYYDNGKWYIEKNIGKVVLNGTENGWSRSGASSDSVFVSSVMTSSIGISLATKQGTNQQWFCNRFTYGGLGNVNKFSAYNPNDTWGYGNLGFGIDSSIANDINTFKTWLGTNNVILYYVKKDVSITEITNETLLSQLNALKGATTYEGQTNIITAGDLQPIIYVKTFAMDNPSYTVTNSGNYFAKPVMTIYGIGTVGVYLDGVQVLSLALNENQTDHITIDVPNMNAYTDTINTLRNRAVIGDYNNLKFNVGDNELSFSGTIQGFIIQNYSRWL